MELLTTLTLAHLLADFPLQTNTIAALKAKSFSTLLTHVLIHVLVTWALLGFRWSSGLLVCGVGIAHLLVDWLKPRLLQTDVVRAFIIDQSAHLACIVLATMAVHIWHPGLQLNTLPTLLLYPSLLLGFAFGGMVFYWLWANTLNPDTMKGSTHLRWSRERLLEIEQRVGFGLICLISISVFFQR